MTLRIIGVDQGGVELILSNIDINVHQEEFCGERGNSDAVDLHTGQGEVDIRLPMLPEGVHTIRLQLMPY